MKNFFHGSEIFLKQGEVYFGDHDTRIRTVLGSCVAITMWHPVLRVGGMCHFMLPSRLPARPPAHLPTHLASRLPLRHQCREKTLDGRYADEALELMLTHILPSKFAAREYQVKMFGGGNMFSAVSTPDKSGAAGEQHVGKKNSRACRELLHFHGLPVLAEHLGGVGHRTLIFDIGTGAVWLKQLPLHDFACVNHEVKEICPID